MNQNLIPFLLLKTVTGIACKRSISGKLPEDMPPQPMLITTAAAQVLNSECCEVYHTFDLQAVV